jgi:hypothetical protein
MWFAPPVVNATVALPVSTPIPCVVCTAETASALTFDGTVELARPGHLDVFDGKTHRTMGFAVAREFRGVESSDGTIKDGPLSRATPGLLARVTYRTVGGTSQVTQILLLTINQCRELKAAEHLSDTPSGCPD